MNLIELQEYSNLIAPKTEAEFIDYARLKLPKDDSEAAAAYERFYKLDPFPNIAPALLNSADIFKYVATTGLIYPFDIDKLRGADYKVPIKGRCIYWDADGNKVENDLNDKSDKVILPPNSISFITLEPIFRVPYYMVLRFNLKVSHVYKGLLLGTGPIVDPGFQGKICIPLHNLTANEYRFNGSEELISMEFTKLSYNQEWFNSSTPLGNTIYGFYRENKFPEYNGEDIYPEKNINKALEGQESNAVISSIHGVLKESKLKAEDAANDANKAKEYIKALLKKINYYAIGSVAIAILSIVIATITILLSSYSLINDTKAELTNRDVQTIEEVNELEKKIIQQDMVIEKQGEIIKQLMNKSVNKGESNAKN